MRQLEHFPNLVAMFFARAAERWLESLADDGTTDAINHAIAGFESDHHFTDAAAAALASRDQHE